MKKKSSRDWIETAIKHPGAEKAAAKKNGMSTMAYAESTDKSPNMKTRRRAQLAEKLIDTNKGKK